MRSPVICCARLRHRQVDVDAALDHRRRHHEDDEQHQHHVHHRHDVDFGQRARPRGGAGARPAGDRRSSPVWTLGTLGEVPFGDVQELHREIVHLRREQLHALRQTGCRKHGRNRRDQTARRRHERVGDAGRDDAEVGRSGLRDAFERPS